MKSISSVKYINAYPLLLTVVVACSTQDRPETSTFDEYSVNESSIFLSPQTSDFVGMPTHIKAIFGGLYVVDNGFQRITRVDNEGNQQFSFGSQGQGPGEFESLAGFWVFDDSYLIYDYNGFAFIMYDHEGNFVEEKIVDKNPVNPDGFPPNIPITVDAISPNKLLIPSRGRNGSLFAIADIETGDLQFAGKAIGEHVESYDQEEVEKAYSEGKIPDIFLNLTILGSSSAGIYSFQQTTGVLEKYSHSGDLLWEKNLKIPAQADLFDQISRKNRQQAKNNESGYLFNYAKAIDADENGVAVLLNMPEGDPVTAVWVPDDGSWLDVVTFHGLDQEELGFLGSFSVSPDDSRAYFLNVLDGIIYEAEWPL